MPDVSETSFEEAIECGLLQHGPDACAGDTTVVRETSPPYGETVPGGYRKRSPANYDRALCLIPRDVVDFILATQPKEWEKLKQHHGAAVTEQFLKRLAGEIERLGALEVLRHGIKDSGCPRSPEPVFLKWKGMEASPEGDFYVRSGPGSVRLVLESAEGFIRTRFPAASKPHGA